MSGRKRRGLLLSALRGVPARGWPAASSKAVVLVVVLALVVGTAGGRLSTTAGRGSGLLSGLGSWLDSVGQDDDESGPEQRWGSAAGASHVVGRSGNSTIPTTMRARYPLRRPVSVPKVPASKRNRARVAKPPAPEPLEGFDTQTSLEVPDRRGSRRRGFVNADGSETTAFSTAPVNYRERRSEAWKPIDPRLQRDGQAGWRNVADDVDLRLASRADATQLAQLSFDAEHEFAFGVAGAAAVPGQADDSAVTYSDALLGGVDVWLQSTPGGLKETLVLPSADAPRRYVFPLSLTGLTATVENDQVLLYDEERRRRAVIPAGFMWDSAEDADRSTGVSYRLVDVDGGPALEMTLDSGWLDDPERQFPVLVDPTVVSDGADAALVVHEGAGSTLGTSELTVGTKDGKSSASYLKFNGLASQLQGHTIFGAQLLVTNFDSGSCKSRPVTVHPVTEGWSPGTGVPYPGPSVGSALTSKSFAYGFIGFGQSKSSCPTKNVLINLGESGRKLVQKWADGGANHGISLRASTSDSLGWKKFVGTSQANPPTLFVTHSPYNAKYEIPDPLPEPPVLQNQSGKVQVTVTNRSAQSWTPSTYYLAYRAYNAETGKSVTQQRAANLPGTVARGAKVTLEATIQALPPGKYFLDFTMVRTGGPVFTDEQVPPGRIVLEVVDIPPVLQELFPPNGYQAPTLAPQLWARAVDIDAPAGSSLQYKFEVCDTDASGNPVGCTTSAYQTSPAWTPPAGRLVWSETYLWRAFVKDATTEVPSPRSTLLTHVPQPAVTSHVAGAPFASQDREFDPQVGNFSTSAVDASVATVGPPLHLVRTYNSLDPRRAPVDGTDPGLDAPFGAGWRTQFDMRLTPDDDGSGNVVISYPDGQEVRFGKNPDGSYAAPPGRQAALTFDAPTLTWTLKDTSGSTFTFSGSGRLTKIADAVQRAIVLSYDPQDGRLTKAQTAPSQGFLGRALHFTWSGGHVATVRTDPVDGQALTWTYTYTGDLLTEVCAPGSVCTTYDYTQGSHYRSAVLDDRPGSYWRLGESDGTGAGSEVAVNLGKDRGVNHDVTLGAAGALTGTDDTAASFNGTSSHVELPKGTLKKSRDAAVEVWFKANTIGSGGPLVGYQEKAVGTASTIGVPLLYHGSDGRLRGQFWNGTVAPMTAPGVVNDGNWHHAVLSSMDGTQTLYLDGVQVATANNPATVDTSKLTINQVGAAYASSPSSWPEWGTTAQRFYNGTIDEVAVYDHPLGPSAVQAHHRYGTGAADQLATVTLPSGKVASEVTYDDATARVTDYTDRHGGAWKIGSPLVYGGNTDLRRGVEVRDPSNRLYLYEFDALTGQMIRSGAPTGLVIRDEDTAGFTPTPTPSPTPTEVCSTPDPGDPQFCSTIPPESEGPVFEGHTLDGIAIRSFSYDANGFLTVVTNENGDKVTMTRDERGNVTSRKTCRTGTECYTEYFTFPGAPADPLDPRSYLATQHRDARSTSPTDNRFLTSYSYHSTGQLLTQTNPDNGVVRHTYTTGGEPAIGGGAMPPGLLFTTTDPRGAVTRYAYDKAGDLARITDPSGLVTNFVYDALGRTVTETETSDSFPAGVTTTYAYDALSRPTRVTEPATTDAVTGARHQAKTTTTYDDDGNVVASKVEDVLGGDQARVTSYTYDEHNHVELVTDAEGGETSYTYDAFGNTTSMVDPNDNRYEYGYTARNQLAEVRLRDFEDDGGPPVGEFLVLHSYAYDFGGRLARDIDAMGRRTEFAYYNDDLLKTVTLKGLHNGDGSTRDFVLESDTYDGAGHLTRQVTGNGELVTDHTVNPTGTVAATVADPSGLNRRTAFTYDQSGNITRQTTSGSPSNVSWLLPTDSEVINYAYDTAGRLTTETQTAPGQPSLVTTHTYDQRGLRTSTTDPRGNVTGADKAAFTTTFGYDERGNQTATTGPAVSAESNGDPAQSVNPAEKVGYNTFGEAVATKDPLGNVVTTDYDRLGRPTRETAPSYTPPGGSPVTPVTETHYDGVGNVTDVIDPLGNATLLTYDRLNRLTTLDEPAASNDDRAVWNHTYTRTGQLLSVTDPTGARVEATYDDLDRQVTFTQVERQPVAGTFTSSYGYDDAGNLTTETSPTGHVTTNTYDRLGELTQTIDPAGVTTSYGYDFAGRAIRETDGADRTHRSDYDLFGHLTKESDLSPTGVSLRTQTYTYDPAGNLVTSKDPLDHTTTFTHDAGNRMTQQVEPVSATESITTTFGYDAAGNRTRVTDGRGNSTIYTVNTLGLPEQVIEPSTAAHPAAADRAWTTGYNAAGDPVRVVAPGGVTRDRTFDAAGRLTRETGAGAESVTAERTMAYDPAGRLTSVSAPGGDNTYTYNDRGLMLTASGPSGTASFDYDAEGHPVQRTDAAGTTQFGYDNDRLATLTDGITSTTQTLGYDAAGMLASIDYGAGRVRSYGYDDLGQLQSDELKNSTGQVVAATHYDHDLADRLTGKSTTGTAGAGDTTYTYDHAGRLTASTNGATTTAYEWDASGNRTGAGTETATYDARNRLLSDGDATYSYTARGTLASKTTVGSTEQLSHDAFDRLVSEEGITYSYDGLDRIAARGGNQFAYAGLEPDPASDGSASYARDSGGAVLATAAGQDQRLAVSDDHGDIVAGIDPADSSLTGLAESAAYEPFGQITAQSPGGITGDVGYQGDWTDPANGQVNMHARWYDPGTGAFTSRDDVTLAPYPSVQANRYTYANADPLNLTDPTGHGPCSGPGPSSGGQSKPPPFDRSELAGFSCPNPSGTAVGVIQGPSASGSGVSGGGGGGGGMSAAERAAAARRAAIARARAVTAAAKRRAARVAKHNRLPVPDAARRPSFANRNEIISANPHVPAKRVDVLRDVVADHNEAIQAIYDKAVADAGPVIEDVSVAVQAVSETTSPVALADTPTEHLDKDCLLDPLDNPTACPFADEGERARKQAWTTLAKSIWNGAKATYDYINGHFGVSAGVCLVSCIGFQIQDGELGFQYGLGGMDFERRKRARGKLFPFRPDFKASLGLQWTSARPSEQSPSLEQECVFVKVGGCYMEGERKNGPGNKWHGFAVGLGYGASAGKLEQVTLYPWED